MNRLERKICVSIVMLLGLICFTYQDALSLTVKNAIDLAIKNNPQLNAERWNSKIIISNLKISYAPFYPHLSVNYSFTHTHSFNGPAYASDNQHTVQALVNMSIFNGFADISTVKENKLLVSAEKLTKDKTLAAVAYEVLVKYINLIHLKNVAAVRRKIVRDTKQNLAAAIFRSKEGLAPLSDVWKWQTEVANAKYNLINSIGNLNSAGIDLANIIGLPKSKINRTSNPDVSDAKFNITAAADFDTEIAKIAQKVQSEKVKEAESGYFPTVNASYSYNWSDSRFFPKRFNEIASISVSLPLFEGFLTKNSVDAARAEFMKSKFEYLDKKNALVTNIRLLKNRLKTDEMLIDEANVSLSGAKKDRSVALDRYKEGIGNLTELLLAENSLRDSYLNLSERKLAVLLDKANIEETTKSYGLYFKNLKFLTNVVFR